MITAVHIEDEPRNIELLESLVKTHYPEVIDMKGSASSLPEAYQLIKKIRPQLVFLDIELNRGNAFELLDKLSSTIGIHFEVIFITAFNEYAVKAFRLNAIDYILKPISTDELKQAVNKAVEKIRDVTSVPGEMATLIKQFHDNLSSRKIAITVAEGVEFYNSDDIIKIEAQGSYSTYYLLHGKKITSTKNLRDIENSLPEASFLRVHHSWIINIKYLKKYYRGKSSYLEMEDGSTVAVSIRKKGKFLDFLE